MTGVIRCHRFLSVVKGVSCFRIKSEDILVTGTPLLSFRLALDSRTFSTNWSPRFPLGTSIPSSMGYKDWRRTVFSLWGGGSKATEWNKAVSEAEKIVGYSTSFLSLRCLLSDELSNVAMQMRKLVGTGHPLLKTARKLFYDDQHALQTRGLLVLLVSKAAGPAPNNINIESSDGIYQSQRTLAEITEMMHTACLIHKGLVNIEPGSLNGDTLKDMEFGNKMAVLSGDFLLANVSSGLATLNNTHVVEIISSALGDLMKAEFTKLRDDEGSGVLPRDGATVKDWELQTFYSSASLMAKSCCAALILANHPKHLQDTAFEFGKQIGFAHRLHQEIQPLTTNNNEIENDLIATSLPAILYAQEHRSKTRSYELLSEEPISSKQVLKILKTDKEVIEKAKKVCSAYGQNAIEALSLFPKSEAKNALKKIVKAVTTF